MKLEELVGKPITEEQFDEAAGKKDACYRKVKARYDVWPSAYASGALVKCRKVGAANWGNKSKKEGLGDRMSKKLKKLKGVNLKKKKVKRLKLKGRGVYQDYDGLDEAKPFYFGGAKHMIFLKKSKMYFDPTNQNLWLGGPGGGPDFSDEPIEPKDSDYKRTLKKLPSVDRMAIKKSMRGKGNFKEDVNEARGTCWVGYQQVGMKKKGGKMVPNCVKETTEIFYEVDGKGYGYTFEYINDGKLNEAEYQGRKVKLGKIMQGDAKKFKVYVKNPKGNVVKVNFGQGGKAKGGTMKIRKSNPKARKSFRARHNCDNPGPRHKARYWSCRKW
jgi:hypothetical protein